MKVLNCRPKSLFLTGCLLAGALLALCLTTAVAAEGKIAVTKGQKIAFLGDSITAAGRNRGGYCRLVIDGLKQQGIEAEPIFAGIGGHKSNQMLGRLERDVLTHKPDWMTLSCGVNDVWHGKNGVPLDAYKKNITEIVTRAQAAGVKVMLLTSTMIREDQPNALNQQLLPYNAFLKQLAKDKNCLLADLNGDMQEALKKFPTNVKINRLTSDGVHMNPLGNIMMAKGVLKAFGLTDAQLTAVEKAWKSVPGIDGIKLHLGLSIADGEKLRAVADKSGKTVEFLLTEFLHKKAAELIKE